jgi:hypothetical protein
MKIILKRIKRHIRPQESPLNILGRKKGSSYGAKETFDFLCPQEQCRIAATCSHNSTLIGVVTNKATGVERELILGKH